MKLRIPDRMIVGDAEILERRSVAYFFIYILFFVSLNFFSIIFFFFFFTSFPSQALSIMKGRTEEKEGNSARARGIGKLTRGR